MVDYYMPPFFAPSDKQATSAVVDLIHERGNHAIQQAPHHFELHALGQVTEDGILTAERYLVADCASLVRRGIRKGPTTTDPEATGETAELAGLRPGDAGASQAPARANQRALSEAPPATPLAAGEGRP